MSPGIFWQSICKACCLSLCFHSKTIINKIDNITPTGRISGREIRDTEHNSLRYEKAWRRLSALKKIHAIKVRINVVKI